MISQADRTILKMAARPETGGLSILAQWFFDTSVLRNQFVIHHAPQPNVLHVGGVGCGKTMGEMFDLTARALLIPYYKGLNTSITSSQAELPFNMLEGFIENNKKLDPFIEHISQRPYPTVTFTNGSEITFRTAGYEARNIRGFEFDHINFDEGGYEPKESTILYLRGRLRGRRPDGTPRLNRLTITTTPTDVPWLLQMWERGRPDEGAEYDPHRYLSLRSTTFDNTFLTKSQIDEIVNSYPDALIEQEIYAKFPDYGLTDFSRASIEQCEDVILNDEMILNTRGGDGRQPIHGWAFIEHPRHGITYWHEPMVPGRLYIGAGDPGSSSPPARNSPCVMVFDCTTDPYKLVFLHWIDGRGSILPFLASYKGAMDEYQPIYMGMDVTGSQKGMEEIAFEEHGISPDRINFQRDKLGMVNSLRYALGKRMVRFPFIKGLHTQLRAYKSAEDKKMAQDLIATFMQVAHLARMLPDRSGATGTIGKTHPRARGYRTDRSRKQSGRRRR